jgi:hypothetical protein
MPTSHVEGGRRRSTSCLVGSSPSPQPVSSISRDFNCASRRISGARGDFFAGAFSGAAAKHEPLRRRSSVALARFTPHTL